MPTSTKGKPPKPLVVRGEDFRQIYVTGAVGNFTPFDYRLLFFTHEPELPDKPKEIESFQMPQVVHAEIIMNIELAKHLRDLLVGQIKQRENQLKKTKKEK